MSESSTSEQSGHNANISPPRVEPVSPWTRIKEHKVLQWSLAYLGAALALAHGQELLAHAFQWPELVGRVLIGTLIVGFPVAVALAWYHGHKGMTRFSAPEMTVVALLLIMGAGMLMVLVRVPGERVAEPLAHPVPATASAPSASAAIPDGPALSSKPRIAILPFENLSPDPANAFFADGLHEEIISTLSSRSPDVEVISRTTMMTYRTPKPVEQIARELGATHVLEGSVRREGNAVRLTLQLINARSDQHVWSQDYDRTLKSALTLQSEVANEVAAQLAMRFASSASSFMPLTRDPQAYDLFLKARLEVENAVRALKTPLEVLQNVEELLSDALARDPDFARAYAQRAHMRMLRYLYNYDTPQHAMPLTQKDLAAAERLAPNDSEVLFVRAIYLLLFERDPARAVATVNAAGVDGLPPIWLAISGEVFNSAGEFDEAIRRAQHALALDPKNTLIYGALTHTLLFERRPAEALRVADLASVEFPAEFSAWRAYLFWAYTGTGSPSATKSDGPIAEITANSDLDSIRNVLVPLRIEHRYQEMANYLGRSATRTIRGDLGFGIHPLAELRGWVHLLLADRAAAGRDGSDVLDFVAHTPETKWNRVLLTLLKAEGKTFIGDTTGAVRASRETLQLSQSLYEHQYVPQLVAAVYAWSGTADDAVSLLEQLSVQIPALADLGPARLARDPLYAVPLAGNARYRALQAKLEAQMAATKQHLSIDPPAD
jgi:TolB-like protein